MIWLVFIACFFATAFVGICAAGLRSAGYDIGGEDE